MVPKQLNNKTVPIIILFMNPTKPIDHKWEIRLVLITITIVKVAF